MSNAPITGPGLVKGNSAIQEAKERFEAPNGTLALNDDGTGFFKGDGVATPEQVVKRGLMVCAQQPGMKGMQQFADDPAATRVVTQYTLEKNTQLRHSDPNQALNAGDVMDMDLKAATQAALKRFGGLENMRKFVESSGSGAIGDSELGGASKFSGARRPPGGSGLPMI